MGHRFNQDGHCKVCKEFSDIFCDSCGLYICRKHQVKKQHNNGMERYVYCESCVKKKRKAVIPQNRTGHYRIDTDTSILDH